MELFGIAASIPAAFVLIALYRIMLLKLTAKYHWVTPLIRPASYLLLVLFVLEVALIATCGPIQSRTLIGPIFLPVHATLFFLGTPALANVILLRRPTGPIPKWYVVSYLCAVFAFLLVLLQYDVSEALFGVDG